jgi:hypothetical protein
MEAKAKMGSGGGTYRYRQSQRDRPQVESTTPYQSGQYYSVQMRVSLAILATLVTLDNKRYYLCIGLNYVHVRN